MMCHSMVYSVAINSHDVVLCLLTWENTYDLLLKKYGGYK